VKRVNLGNVLDEELRIGGRGRRRNSKVKDQTNKVKLAILLRQSQYYKLNLGVPSCGPLLTRLYRWPGVKVQVGFDTDSSPMAVFISTTSLFVYKILRLLSWAVTIMGLNHNIF
jgi:hypothetical protein